MVDRVKLSDVSQNRGVQVRKNTQFTDAIAQNAKHNAANLSKLSNSLNNYLDDQTIRKATRAGMKAGEAQSFKVMEEDTLAGQAFNKAARSTYMTTVETNARRKFDELFEKHSHDPAELRLAFEGYKQGTIKELREADETLIPLYEEIYDRHTRTLVKQSHKNALEVQRKNELTSTLTAVENNIKGVERIASLEQDDFLYETALIEERELVVGKLTEIGPPQAFEFEGVKYEADPTRSGSISVETMATVLSDLDDRTAVARVMNKFESASDKSAFLANFEANPSKALTATQNERLASKMQTELRAARTEQNARRALLKDDISDAIFVLERGRTPAGYDALLTATNEFPELQQDLLVASQSRELSESFVKSTPLEQLNSINEVNARLADGEEPTRADIELLERFEKLHNETIQGLDNDPVSFGNEVGLYQLQDIDPKQPESLLQRRQVAEELRDRYGIVTHGLTEVEISMFENELEHGDSADKMALFAGAEQAMTGDQFGAFMAEIAPKQPVLSMSATLTQDAPKLSHEIMRAHALTEDPEISKFMPSKTDYSGIVDSYFGDAFKHNANGMSQVIQSALAVDLLRRQQAGKLEDFSDGDLEAVFEEITGGVFEYNDQKILAPRRGITENSFEDRIERLTDSDLDMSGVIPRTGDGSVITAEIFKEHATLESIGQGLYLVRINGFYAQDGAGNPYEFNFEEISQAPAPMGGTIQQ